MSFSTKKVFSFLMVTLSLLGVIDAAFGWDYYPTSYHWGFQNYSYLGFNQAMNFTDAPHQGVPYDNSLVSYWNMNEGSGAVTHDSSDNGNNGTITGASWVDGKYGKALSFSGTDNYVLFPQNTFDSLFKAGKLTLSCWIKTTSSNTLQVVIGIEGVYILSIGYIGAGKVGGFVSGTSSSMPVSAGLYNDGNWHHIALTYDGTTTRIWADGQLVASAVQTLFDITSLSYTSAIGADYNGRRFYFNGTIDDMRIYNRSLSPSEVATLYTMNPYSQPDPVSFANYYTYTDSVTNNTLLIYVDNPNANSNNVAVVTCTNFFVGNRLAFQANNSATVSVWTNLGQPAFTTGVWNSENYTTTLTLTDASTAELTWPTYYNITTYADAHSGVSPSNATVGYEGSQTFNFNASQGYRFNVVVDGVSQGQISSYTFSNVTAPHAVNVTSTQLFTIIASAGGNGSITPSGPVVLGYGENQQFNFTANTGYHVNKVLVDNASQSIADSYTFSNVQKNHTLSVSFDINTYNITATADAHSTITPGNVSVNHGESQQFNITTDSGYVSRVFVDGEDQGNLTSYNFTDVQGNHAISVTSEPVAPTNTSSPTAGQSPSTSPISSPGTSQTPQTSGLPSPSSTQQPTSTPTTETSKFPTETVLIAAAAIAAVIALFALAFKRGYISVEKVDEEENPDEEASSEKKSKSGTFDETPDYNQLKYSQMEKLMTVLKLMGENVKEGAVGSLAKAFSVCVEGVYVKDEKILLLKRNVEPFKGYWHVVGGQVEENETLKDALKREFKEETNLDVEVEKIIGGRIEETFDRTKLIVAFEVASAQGEIKLNPENAEYGWFGQVPLNSVYDYTRYLRKTV